MRPIIRDDAAHFDPQTHAYAEYRVFSSLAARYACVTGIVVELAHQGRGSRTVVSCTIVITIAGGEILRAGATEHHAHAAIDRATLVGAALLERASPRAGAATAAAPADRHESS